MTTDDLRLLPPDATSVRFVKETIDSWPLDPATNSPVGIIRWIDGFKGVPRPGVWQAIVTRSGGEVVGDD